MAAFIPGLTLAERFYREAVRPILDAEFPALPHAAALVGSGSEVLGFDTPVSTDHHWGPRVQLFLSESDHAHHARSIREVLRHRLPRRFLGWPTNFTEPDPLDHGTQRLRATREGPVNHRVDVLTVHAFVLDYLGFDLREDLHPHDWLTFPSQKLRAITQGALFHDAIGLADVRQRLTWYPSDVWLYLLAAGWKRISQEEHLMGRAAQVGDEIGSRLIAGRLVRDLMRLVFLMERQYAPYPKWYGTAWAQLAVAAALDPLLHQALQAETWTARDRALADAYAFVARMQNGLALMDPLPASPVPFFGRPFSVIFGERFADAVTARIEDPRVRTIPVAIGSIDQWSDSTDLLEAPALRVRLKTLYRALE